MAIDLSGRTIAITGASSGIGRATAFACARAGMRVVIGARRQDELDDVAAQIRSAGHSALPLRCDVTDPDDGAALVTRAEEAFGPLYAVFANAGYGHEAATLEMPDEDWRAMFETNFWGTLNVVRPAAARMLEAGRGHVLVCSSCLSKIAIPCYAAYTSSKACQDHLSRALRIELADAGVHVSSVHPVGTRTEFFDKASERSGRPKAAGRQRFMQPPDRVARAIVACLRRPRPEVWTSHAMRLALALSSISPRLTDAALRAMHRRRPARRARFDESRPA